MDFLSTLLSSDTAKFVGRHVLIGITQACRRPLRQAKSKPRNVQCVKLTKEHDSVTRMVTYWSNLRINQLQQQGMSTQALNQIVKSDARFLTSLTHAIAMQKEENPDFDAWLFFNDDVQSTDFFELQHCNHGSKVTRASFVIQATC